MPPAIAWVAFSDLRVFSNCFLIFTVRRSRSLKTNGFKPWRDQGFNDFARADCRQCFVRLMQIVTVKL